MDERAKIQRRILAIEDIKKQLETISWMGVHEYTKEECIYIYEILRLIRAIVNDAMLDEPPVMCGAEFMLDD